MHDRMGYTGLSADTITEQISKLDEAMRVLSAAGQSELAKAIYVAAKIARRDREMVEQGARYERVA